MSEYNLCTCVSDAEATCIVHPSRDRASKYKARSMFIEHANQRLASDNVLLEAENKALREAMQAAFDCDMIPISTASDGGAARHSEQVRVADMLRKVMEKDDERANSNNASEPL